MILQGMKPQLVTQNILGKPIIDLNQLNKQDKSPCDFMQLKQNIYQENYSLMKVSPRSALGLEDVLLIKQMENRQLIMK